MGKALVLPDGVRELGLAPRRSVWLLEELAGPHTGGCQTGTDRYFHFLHFL